MPINYYKTGADSGLADTDAIEPVENGEPVEQAYLNRPSWNLQNRTEMVRQSFDGLQALVMSNSALTLSAAADAKINFYESGVVGRYKIVVNASGLKTDPSDRDLYIYPLVSAAKPSANAYKNAKFVKIFDSGATLSLESNYPVHDGGHNILVRMFYEDGVILSDPAITVEGKIDPSPGSNIPYRPLTVAIKISSDGATTIDSIKTAIESSEAYDLVTPTVTSGTLHAATTDCFESTRIYDGDIGSTGGLDAEGIRISSTVLNSFFATEYFIEGDVLAVHFDSGRTRRGLNPGTSILIDNLAVLKTGMGVPDLGDCDGIIPIGKMFDGRFVLLNGKMLSDNVAQYVNISDNVSSVLADDIVADTLSVTTVVSSLIPDANTRHLGSSGTHWGTLYATNIVGPASGGGISSFDTATILHELNVGDADGVTGTIFKGPFEHRSAVGATKFHIDPAHFFNVGIGAAAETTDTCKLYVNGKQKIADNLRVGSGATPTNLVVDVTAKSGHVGINTEPHATDWLYVNGGIRQTYGNTTYLGSVSSDNDADALFCRTSLCPLPHDAVTPGLGDTGNVWDGLFTRDVDLQGADPYVKIHDTDTADTEEQKWKLLTSGNLMKLQLLSHDELSSRDALTVDRDGYVGQKVTLDLGTTGGTTSILQLGSYIPCFDMQDLKGTTNETMWRLTANTGVLYLQTRTDAGGAGANILTVDRTGTTADKVSFYVPPMPNSTGAVSLGHTDYHWGTLYADYIGCSILPLGTIDFGSTSYRWQKLYTGSVDFASSEVETPTGGTGTISLMGASTANSGLLKIYINGALRYIPIWTSV